MIRLNLWFALPFFFLLQGGQHSTAFDNNPLPVKTNYPVVLKQIRHEQLEKYDYLEYSGGKDLVQVKYYKHISKEKALKIIDDRKFIMKLAFEDQVSPYPGFLSNTVGCPDDLKPKAKEDTLAATLAYKLLATSNFVYGNCNINDNYYYSLYEIIYCPLNLELYEMKFFTPVKEPSFDYHNFVFAFECPENK